MKVFWKKDSQDVTTLEELYSLLERIEKENREHPILVTLGGSGEQILLIGVDNKETVLATNTKSGTPPYYLSLGDEKQQGIITFLYDSEATDFRRSNVISYDKAKEVVKEFFETGNLSDKIQWEEV